MDAYITELATAHGINGHTTLPDGTIVYGAYRDGNYDLYTPDRQLTNGDGDITAPQWLDERDTILAHRDHDGNEQYDLLEVDHDTGDIHPILDDEFLNMSARQSPTDPNVVAVISNRDRSLDLYTVNIDTGDITKHSETDETVHGYAWSPGGDQLVYQAGLIDNSTLRLVDLTTGNDTVLIDEPDSEQSLAYADQGRDAWSPEGIVFTTNHTTGYREIAVTDPSGAYDIRYTNERDKYDAKWTPDGQIVFVETQGGNRVLRRVNDDAVTTIESTGLNMSVKWDGDGVSYIHQSPTTAGNLHKDGDTIVAEGQVDVPTVMPEEVTYESVDGQEISARLYTPRGDPKGGIVKPHGGPPAQHFTHLDLFAQTLVEAGFEVLAPDFRGSIGYGRTFRKATDGDLGGTDLDDVTAGADYLRDRGRSGIGITGTSYGGYLTLLAVGKTNAFDAGASIAGVVNWETTGENARQYLGDYLIRKLGGTPAENPSLYEDRSPITYVDDITAPVLIAQGENDPRVPQSEAKQLVSSLSERDIPYEYLLFEDEGHAITRTDNRIEYGQQAVSFFESHL